MGEKQTKLKDIWDVNCAMHSAQELVHCMDRLASLPSVFHRIQAELDSPDSSLSTLAQLISSDPALSATLLKVANSALFGFPQRIETILRAVQVLGVQQVRELSVAILVTRTFTALDSKHVDPEHFWRTSILRAVACRAAFGAARLHPQERGFVTGLLANIGHMVMYLNLPELAIAAANRAAAEAIPLYRAERQTIGCDHAEVAACLAASWGLPQAISGAIATQHAPWLANGDARDAWLLHLANAIVGAEQDEQPSEEAGAAIDQRMWPASGLEPSCFAPIREEAELNLASTLALFFPRRT